MNSIQKLRTAKGNYRKLLQNAGYTSVKAFRRDNPEFSNDGEAYTSLLGMYNNNVDYILEQQRAERERIRLQQRAVIEQERLQQRQRKQKQETGSYNVVTSVRWDKRAHPACLRKHQQLQGPANVTTFSPAPKKGNKEFSRYKNRF